MGLFGFGRKSMEERQEEALQSAEKIGQGRGFTGRMTKMMMGSEFTDQVAGATQAARDAQQGAAAAAMASQSGAPTHTATVTQIADTGQSINDNPIVELQLDLDGRLIVLRTLVSRLQIPRVGDRVLLVDGPNGEQLYGGLAAG